MRRYMEEGAEFRFAGKKSTRP